MRGLSAALLAGIAVAGCSAQQCDPSQAGFLSGIGCEAGGSYRTRNQAQQSALAQENANALQARATAQDEQGRANQAVLSRDQARQRLGAVDRDTRALRARLASARARGTSDRGRLDAAQTELDSLQRQRSGLGTNATDAQVQALEAQRRRAAELLGGI